MASKNYSGKRVAGRKPVGKRALGLLMALVMSLSLVQITAFAVDGRTNQVVNAGGTAYYKADGTEGNANDWAVKVKRTLAETGTENLFDVNLEVTTKDKTVVTDADAAAVLVIDTSGSMGRCAGCGAQNKDAHEKAAGEWVYKCDKGDGVWEDKNNDGRCDNCGERWTSGWGFWEHYTHTRTWVSSVSHEYESRLSAAKQAAKSFLDSYALNASGATSTAPRYVAVVEYAKDAYTVQAMVDVTNEESRNEAKSVIDGLQAGGGTNTEAGLQLASNLLATQNSENKFVVLLTDGQPTYAIGEDGTRTGTEGPIPGDKLLSEDYIGNGTLDSITQAVTAPVETMSSALTTAGVHVYGVVYGLTKQDGTMETVPNGKGENVAIDTWMQNDCQMDGVYSADSVDALNAAFKTILNTIQNESVSTTVVTAVNNMTGEDDLKDLYTFVQFTKQNGATVTNNEVSWDLSKAASEAGTAEGEKTYQMSYQVRMHTETAGFQPSIPYSLGAATLSFQVNGGTAKEVAFPDVTAKGYLGGFRFTKVDNEDGKTLAGAEFQLSAANVKTLSAASDVNGGVVAFIGIPSGYTYTLSETKAPEGYTATVETWTVTVAYGEVIISQGNDVVRLDVVENTKTPVTPPEPTYTLTVKYQDEEGKQLKADVVTGNLAKDSPYAADNSNIVVNGTEYTYKALGENSAPLTGTITGDTTVIIIYQVKEITPPEPEYVTVTVNYVELDNADNVLREAQSKQFKMENGAAAYDVTDLKFSSLDKDGKTYNYNSASENLTGYTQGDLSITLYYKVKSSEPIDPPVTPTYSYYTVTVNYYDKDSGEVIHEKYSTTQREYTSYDVTAQDAIAIEGYTYAETTGDALKGTLNGNKTINVYYTKDSTPVNPPVTPVDPPVDPNPVAPPETGDAMGFWIAAAAVSGLGLVWLALSSRKRREEA